MRQCSSLLSDVKSGRQFLQCVRSACSPERRKVKRILKLLLYRKTGSYSYWDRRTIDDMRECDLNLRRVSPEMGNLWRRWAFPWLKKRDSTTFRYFSSSSTRLMWKESLMDPIPVTTGSTPYGTTAELPLAISRK